MLSHIKSILAKIKSSVFMQPQNRWLLRTGLVVVGIALTAISYHYITLEWDGSYSASRSKGGDYSVILMFPFASFLSFLKAIGLTAGFTAFLYAITLPRVKPKGGTADQSDF